HFRLLSNSHATPVIYTLSLHDALPIFVSSSRVRELIRAGQVEQAGKLLSAPYRIRGMVTHGAGRGAKIGFPTANLSAIDTLLPRSEEHTSELQSLRHLVCRLLLEKKKK